VADLTERTQAAFADACQEQGRLRRPSGGDAADLPGIRLWSAGIAAPALNGGAVDDASAVDIATVSAWFAARAVPWGVLVPVGMHWPYGRHLMTKALMALEPPQAVAADVPGVVVRTATPADLADVLAVDAEAFGVEDAEVQRRWVEPHLSAFSVTTVVGELDGAVVGTAYAVRSDGRAGAALSIGGVGVLPAARGRGVAAAMSAALVTRGLETGAELVHLSHDTDAAARVYARLGFTEVGGMEIYVDNGPERVR
jgi:ribosomal protein S18 acetylase RimI-like enzyme